MTLVDRVKPLRRIALPFTAVLALIPALVAGCDEGFDDGPICGDIAFSDDGFAGGCCGGFEGGGCCGGGDCPPVDQPVSISPVRPQPLAGGTLFIAKGADGKAGHTALVSDPDRDRVMLVDLKTTAVVTIATGEGANPGRATQDAAGVLHVLLRNSSSMLNIDPKDPQAFTTSPVCEQPRGIAFHTTADKLLVACSNGEVQTLSSGKNPAFASSKFLAEGDLRDIVVSNNKVFVSHFRSTNIDLLDVDMVPVKTRAAHAYTGAFEDVDGVIPTYTPTVAWRMIPRQNGGVLVVHQEARSSSIVLPEDPGEPGGGGSPYGGFDCNTSILHSSVTGYDDDGESTNGFNAGGLAGLPLPVDIALASDGERIAIVGAGNSLVVETTIDTVTTHDGCQDNFPANGGGFTDGTGNIPDGRVITGSAEPIAAAYDSDDNLVVQLREPAALEIHGNLSGQLISRIELGGETRFDTGYTMFHGNPDPGSAAQLTCASCHPEGREDGHVWTFTDQGPRRTQSLAGDIASTAPFHWVGDLSNLGAIMDEVFVRRMGGFKQSAKRVDAVQSFIFTFPAAPRVVQPLADAATRGKAVFERSDVGCADCHNGGKFTNNATVSVGTNGSFQVPSLTGIASRGPFMHDGCAKTMRDRFNPECGGGDAHGVTSHLSEGEISDMIAFLDTL